MDWIQAIELFATVTGIAYVVLEIMQKNAMWVLGILTGAACAVSFGIQHVWASMGLNLYYVVMSVFGFVQWRKAGTRVDDGEIHLAVLPKSVGIWSAVILLAGSLVLMQVLRATGDAAPRLDALATMLSVIGTWWLAQSYLQQWMLWVVADILLAILCISTGQYWMAGMYAVYTASAIYGYFHWKRLGHYID